jgi:hypothetical protein
MEESENDIVKAVSSNKVIHTNDWSRVRRPKASAETVRLNQASSGIAATYSYPLNGEHRGVMMYNFYQYIDSIGDDQMNFMQRYTELVSKYLDAEPAAVAT